MAKLLPAYLTAVSGLPFSYKFASSSKVATSSGIPQKLTLTYDGSSGEGLYYYTLSGIPVHVGVFDITFTFEDGDSMALKLIVGLEIG